MGNKLLQFSIAFVMMAATGGCGKGGETAPSITITEIPPAGAGADTWGTIGGEVTGVEPKECKVVIFVFGDVWYVQPLADSPYTTIGRNGKWKTGIHLGYNYAALLVKASYRPPATTDKLPAVGGDVVAFATAAPAGKGEASGKPTAKTLQFSGYEWRIKSSRERAGPGPNHFSDTDENVWVDRQSRLHLKIAQRNEDWYCAEVISNRSFGYGTYRFYLNSDINSLDPNAILGLFTWSDDPAFSNREIDIECARWGKAKDNTNAQFVVQPYNPPGHLVRFTVPSGADASTHSFTWEKDSISFSCIKGHHAAAPESRAVIREWAFAQQGVPQAGGENARINLWLMGGKPPANGREIEVIISKFEFVPLDENGGK